MKATLVKDLMIPFSECATIHEDATLYDAVVALEATRIRCDRYDYRIRVILVYDKAYRVIGTLRIPEVLRGLESKYLQLGKGMPLSADVVKPEYSLSVMKEHDLWSEPLEAMCRKALEVRVKDIMSVPTEAEYTHEDEPINEAIHRMLMGNYLSLVVRGEKGFLGILRLSDIFSAVCAEIRACGMESA